MCIRDRVQTQISLPFISAGADGPLHFEATLTRAKFDEMTKHLVDRTMEPVRNALRDAGLTKNDIHQVLLVGGSTRIPAVQDAVKNALGKEPNRSVNPVSYTHLDVYKRQALHRSHILQCCHKPLHHPWLDPMLSRCV